MNEYSYQDLLRMQEEAKARVMEMRRRSRFVAEDFAGREKTNAECGVRNAELRHGQDPQSREQGREAPQRDASERRAHAIRMPVELPEHRRAGPSEASAPKEENVVPAAAPEPAKGPGAAATVSPAKKQNAARGNPLPAALRHVFGEMDREETEKMFLLSLFLLLSQENGDEGLLLSLMYLLT